MLRNYSYFKILFLLLLAQSVSVFAGNNVGQEFVWRDGNMLRDWSLSRKSDMYSLGVCSGGKYFIGVVGVLRGPDDTVYLWDFRTGQLLLEASVSGFAQVIDGVSEDGKYFGATGWTYDYRYYRWERTGVYPKVWDLATGKEVDTKKVSPVLSHCDLQTGLDIGNVVEPADIRLADVKTAVNDGRYIIYAAPSGVRYFPAAVGMDLFSRTYEMEMSRLLESKLGPAPQAPKLEKGKFETSSQFSERVEKSRAAYEKEVEKYNEKLKKINPDKLKTDTLAMAFRSAYGKPVVSDTVYDADSGIFAFNIKSDGAVSRKSEANYHFTLSEALPNDKAESFDKKLRKAEPEVFFKLAGDKLVLEKAQVKVGGKIYTATPSEAVVQVAETADLSKLSAASAIQPEKVTVSEIGAAASPELAAKAAELARLQKEKADKAKIASMEAEIAKLRGEGGRTFSSDIETPDFSSSQRSDDFALVIGIEGYKGKDLPKAEYAERDADTVKAYLLALGVPERNIKIFKGSDATNATLKNYLESWLPKNVKADSRVYFYFSGHGSPDPQKGSAYLMPWDGDPAFLETSAYPLEQVYSSLGRLKSKEVFIAMDACFSGAGGRSVLQKGLKPLVVVQAEGTVPPNLTVFAASSGDEPTGGLDDKGHGIFTYYLLKGLASGKRDSHVLCDYLSPQVKDAAARQNRSQTPVCRGPEIRF